jgi:hypothetical protein
MKKILPWVLSGLLLISAAGHVWQAKNTAHWKQKEREAKYRWINAEQWKSLYYDALTMKQSPEELGRREDKLLAEGWEPNMVRLTPGWEERMDRIVRMALDAHINSLPVKAR